MEPGNLVLELLVRFNSSKLPPRYNTRKEFQGRQRNKADKILRFWAPFSKWKW